MRSEEVSKYDDYIKDIADIVCKFYKITFEMLTAKTRYKTQIEARQITHSLCKDILGDHVSLAEIGRVIGQKDHTTVMHSIKTVTNLCETYGLYRIKYLTILSHCQKQVVIKSSEDIDNDIKIHSRQIEIKKRLQKVNRYQKLMNMRVSRI